MSKTNTETQAVLSSPTENTHSDTVEISRDEFEQMKAQLALLTKQMTSENRLKSASDEKLARDLKLLDQVNTANEKAMEEVEIYIDKGSLKSNKNAEVSINGVQYIIPKGKVVKVPRCVKEVIDNSERQRDVAFGLQEEKNAEFEKALASGNLNN